MSPSSNTPLLYYINRTKTVPIYVRGTHGQAPSRPHTCRIIALFCKFVDFFPTPLSKQIIFNTSFDYPPYVLCSIGVSQREYVEEVCATNSASRGAFATALNVHMAPLFWKFVRFQPLPQKVSHTLSKYLVPTTGLPFQRG